MPWKVPSDTTIVSPQMTMIRHNHWGKLICSSLRRNVMIAIPTGNEYKIIKTIAMSRTSMAWYVDAIRLTETRLEKRMGRINLRGIRTDFFWKTIIGVKRNRPIRHREKSKTNSDDPKSKEALAAVGTTAKHKDDNMTTNIPIFFLLFPILSLKITTRIRFQK